MDVYICVGFVMCGCVHMCGFCNVWVCLCVGFVMCGCVYMCGFCNVWVCVGVGFVMCGCVYMCGFCNVWVCVGVGFVLNSLCVYDTQRVQMQNFNFKISQAYLIGSNK